MNSSTDRSDRDTQSPSEEPHVSEASSETNEPSESVEPSESSKPSEAVPIATAESLEEIVQGWLDEAARHPECKLLSSIRLRDESGEEIRHWNAHAAEIESARSVAKEIHECALEEATFGSPGTMSLTPSLRDSYHKGPQSAEEHDGDSFAFQVSV